MAPKQNPFPRVATGPTSATAAVCGVFRLDGQQTFHAGVTVCITPAWPTAHCHWDRWVVGDFSSHT